MPSSNCKCGLQLFHSTVNWLISGLLQIVVAACCIISFLVQCISMIHGVYILQMTGLVHALTTLMFNFCITLTSPALFTFISFLVTVSADRGINLAKHLHWHLFTANSQHFPIQNLEWVLGSTHCTQNAN